VDLDGTRLSRSISCKSFADCVSSTETDKTSSKTYPDEEGAREEVREGYNPDHVDHVDEDESHNLNQPFTVGDYDEDEEPQDELGQDQPWEARDYDGNQGSKTGSKNGSDHGSNHDSNHGSKVTSPQYGSFNDERDAWGGR
jgi:hypothetical protein